MTTVRATCEECGDVELGIAELLVRLCAESGEATYVFTCPDCRQVVVVAAEPVVVDVLVASGAQLVVWSLPGELYESHGGPPISYDDVLDFHLLLQQPHWFDAVRALTRTISS